jgi:hypothetical protein
MICRVCLESFTRSKRLMLHMEASYLYIRASRFLGDSNFKLCRSVLFNEIFSLVSPIKERLVYS